MTKIRRRKIASLMSESDSNAGNARLIRAIKVDNCRNPAWRWLCTFPMVWWS